MLDELTSSVRAGLVELVRPGEGGLLGSVARVRTAGSCVTLVIVATNLIGAARCS